MKNVKLAKGLEMEFSAYGDDEVVVDLNGERNGYLKLNKEQGEWVFWDAQEQDGVDMGETLEESEQEVVDRTNSWLEDRTVITGEIRADGQLIDSVTHFDHKKIADMVISYFCYNEDAKTKFKNDTELTELLEQIEIDSSTGEEYELDNDLSKLEKLSVGFSYTAK